MKFAMAWFAAFLLAAGSASAASATFGAESGAPAGGLAVSDGAVALTVSNFDKGNPPPPPSTCGIFWTNRQQHIDGFGFSSAWCGQLSSAKNAALYGTLGMSLLRIRIDEHNNWSQETANAAAAHAYGAKVLGCPWRAPASMVYYVTNVTANSTNIFTYMSNTNFGAFATWLNQAANAHNLDYVSVKNEPDLYDSSDLNLTADQIRIFCASNAPAIGRPVTMADAVGFTDSVSDPTLNDSNAVNNVSIVSGHFYGGGNYVHTNALAHGKPVWMTEHYLDGCVTNFPVCLNFAKEINDAMTNQFSAYIAWWAQDGDGNINLANTSGTILKDGYTMGQFAKFIRPGFYRVGTTNSAGGPPISAYQDLTTSNFVIVALNLGSTVVTQQFNLNGFPTMPTNLSVTPWLTSYTQSLAVQSPITNVSSTFTYLIQPSNIVTFVATPPVATPMGLTAAPDANKVSLSWNAVAGVTNYNVKRANVSGGPYTTVGSTSGTNYSDTGLAGQTAYYYVVSALIGAGQSPDSQEASAITPAVYTALPLADTYVENTNPNNNYGTLTNLYVKNSSGAPVRNIYLMFDVHALANVKSATVTLTANRVDAPATLYYQVASTNWTEGNLTWNNQPGGTGAFLYTNTVNGTGVVTFDVTSAAASQATNGGLLSIEITAQANTANSLIQFVSKESTNPSLQPVLTYTLPANTPPTLAAISNQTIGAGITLNITNMATDSDLPAQMLTFSLPTAPTNAVINATNGVLTWRPWMTQANTTNPFTVIVADNGTPSMSATQSFVVAVSPLVQPQIPVMSLNGGQMMLQVSGAAGPDYQIQSSPDLVNWSVVLTTNSPVMPFVWTNDVSTGPPMNFYRVLVGPPLP